MKIDDHFYFFPEQGVLDCNTYVIKDEKTLIVDLGLSDHLSALVNAMRQDGIDPHAIDTIANTHLHLDHTSANQIFKKEYGPLIMLAPQQKEYYDVSVRRVSRFFGVEPVEFTEDGQLDSLIDLGSITLEVISTPGHSPESICFYCSQNKALICGDLLFDHNTGRSDLPGGNGKQLRESINALREREIDLLLPGHMQIVEGKDKVIENFEYVKNHVFQWL